MDTLDSRKSWDEYFIEMCDLVASRSTCLRRSVGAIITKDHRIISTGYNGAPTGIPHCEVCIRNEQGIESGTRAESCYAVHAEQNALISAAYLGNSTKGCTMYCNLTPCSICMKLIINSGVLRLVLPNHATYPDELSKELLEKSEIEVVLI